MNLREEFNERISILENAGRGEITPRLSGLFDWMEAQPGISTILDTLSFSGIGEALLRQSYTGHPPQAATPVEVAAVGLELLDRSVTLEIELWVVAQKCGIADNSFGNDAEKYIHAALTRYIVPMLNYVSNQLSKEGQETSQPQIANHIQESLNRFGEDYPDPARVAFIMMRFGDSPPHFEIENVIKATLRKHGFTGVLARDRQYHDDLFSNIQTYLHGCGFGISVFERIEKDDFNPNISLEVGYMLALNKQVLLLKDKSLKALQTDLVGKLYRPFNVHDVANSMPAMVESWLQDKRLI
jgi:hypothetical protein